MNDKRPNDFRTHRIFLALPKIHLIHLISFLLILLTSTYSFAHKEITICGTGDSQNLLQDLAHAFETSHPEATINVPDSIGSSGGIRMTASGKCDLGRIARPLKEKEKKHNLKHLFFASSPVVFIVHKSVPISNLTSQQATAILSGTITNWEAIGGSNMKIFVAKREAGDSSRIILEKNIPQLLAIKNWAGQTIYSTKETVDTVSKYKGTFSFAPMAMCNDNGIRILTYNGMAPTAENIASGLYPLAVQLGLVWMDELHETSKDFVEFIKSPKGSEIVLQHNTLPLN